MNGWSPVGLAFRSTARPAARLLLILVSTTAAAAQRCPIPAAVLEDLPLNGAMAHVRYPAADDLSGREVATAGERCASLYIAEALREAGLEPRARDQNYFHGFPVRTATILGPRQLIGPGGTPLAEDGDWTPLAASAGGSVTAPLTCTSGVSSNA
jgi:hypothetical protein